MTMLCWQSALRASQALKAQHASRLPWLMSGSRWQLSCRQLMTWHLRQAGRQLRRLAGGFGLVRVWVLLGSTAFKNVTRADWPYVSNRYKSIAGRRSVVTRHLPQLNGNQAGQQQQQLTEVHMMPPLLRTVTVSALVVSACVGCIHIPSRLLGWLYGLGSR